MCPVVNNRSFPVHNYAPIHKDVWMNGGIYTCIFYLGTRWRLVVAPRRRTHLPYLLVRRLVGPQNQSGLCAEERNFLPEIDLRGFGRPARNLATTSTCVICFKFYSTENRVLLLLTSNIYVKNTTNFASFEQKPYTCPCRVFYLVYLSRRRSLFGQSTN
jgi:hypothetical protein